MGDVFIRKARQRRDFKFVYKRKIFLHAHPWPSQDPAFNRLVYLQVGAPASVVPPSLRRVASARLFAASKRCCHCGIVRLGRG